MGKHHRRSVSVIPIASPLAGHRLTKKIGDLITKSADQKQLVYGVKDTGKALRKARQEGTAFPFRRQRHVPLRGIRKPAEPVVPECHV